jgi:hypothetical protein
MSLKRSRRSASVNGAGLERSGMTPRVAYEALDDEEARRCYSCMHVLIPGRDDLAIEIQDRIQESYKRSHIFGRQISVEQATWQGRARLSAKHLRKGIQHALFALRLFVIPAEMNSNCDLAGQDE